VPATAISPPVVVGLLPLTVCEALKSQMGACAAPVQAPPTHVWPDGQSVLVQQVPLGTQAPVLHVWKPAGHAAPQTPLLQVATAPGAAVQTLPQRPQLFGSESVFPQDGSTSIVQAPNVHGMPNGHWMLQPPQWFGSDCVLMHWP